MSSEKIQAAITESLNTALEDAIKSALACCPDVTPADLLAEEVTVPSKAPTDIATMASAINTSSSVKPRANEGCFMGVGPCVPAALSVLLRLVAASGLPIV
jgi:hypothetical protein